jgi:hypothetical protein
MVRIPKPHKCGILAFFEVHVKFDIFMALNIEIVFLDMMSCSLVDTNVSEKYAASVFRVEE